MTQADPHTARMVALMERLAPVEGYNLSALEDVRFLRSNRPLSRTPVLYDPGIVILCQGRKRGYLGNNLYVYDARHYLVVSVPVPFTMETEGDLCIAGACHAVHLCVVALALTTRLKPCGVTSLLVASRLCVTFPGRGQTCSGSAE